MKTNLEINIDRLVIHGLPLENRELIGQAIEAELVRLIQEKGVPQNWSNEWSIPHLRFDAIEIAPQAQGHQLGAQIAQTMYTGFNQPSNIKE